VNDGPSRTAVLAAVARGRHRLEDDPPWVLDDPLALLLVGPRWTAVRDAVVARGDEEVSRQSRGGLVARARYAEDRLLHGGFTQYVVLGAGLDTFAWRRPDVVRRTRVVEVDHPASQAWKRERAAVLGLPDDERHSFAAVDFERTDLAAGLDATGFDWTAPTLWSWLGVTMYLTVDAIERTLQTIAARTGSAPGSEVVLTYAPAARHLDDVGRRFSARLRPAAESSGEGLRTAFEPEEIEALLSRCGLAVVDHPGRDEIIARYFAGRGDGLVPYTCERMLTARV
jgi:methyltransferase (TIGR00027 family)